MKSVQPAYNLRLYQIRSEPEVNVRLSPRHIGPLVHLENGVLTSPININNYYFLYRLVI